MSSSNRGLISPLLRTISLNLLFPNISIVGDVVEKGKKKKKKKERKQK